MTSFFFFFPPHNSSQSASLPEPGTCSTSPTMQLNSACESRVRCVYSSAPFKPLVSSREEEQPDRRLLNPLLSTSAFFFTPRLFQTCSCKKKKKPPPKKKSPQVTSIYLNLHSFLQSRKRLHRTFFHICSEAPQDTETVQLVVFPFKSLAPVFPFSFWLARSWAELCLPSKIIVTPFMDRNRLWTMANATDVKMFALWRRAGRGDGGTSCLIKRGRTWPKYSFTSKHTIFIPLFLLM